MSTATFRKSLFFRYIALTVLAAFAGLLPVQPSFAQVASLPAVGSMVEMTPKFDPMVVKGIKLYPDNPFKFDFIVDTGDMDMSRQQIKDQGQKLASYFLASLTTPENEMWVNLSPYEHSRIIPKVFGQTEMGKELLSEDYMLKQIMATALYPERQLGQEFWQTVYAKAQEEFGTTNVPVSTFNKVWILPQEAVVYENARMNAVFVVKSRLKVMLEQDYLAANKHKAIEQFGMSESAVDASTNKDAISSLSSRIIKEIVIPALEKEVNEGRNFAGLRQVYSSLILAAWYKKNLHDNVLSKGYVDQRKILGVEAQDKQISEKIYQQYLKAYRKGVYNYVKEEVDPATNQVIPRKYFSGGVQLLQVQAAMRAANNNEILPFNAAMNNRALKTALMVIGFGLVVGLSSQASANTVSPAITQPAAVQVLTSSGIDSKGPLWALQHIPGFETTGVEAYKEMRANGQIHFFNKNGAPLSDQILDTKIPGNAYLTVQNPTGAVYSPTPGVTIQPLPNGRVVGVIQPLPEAAPPATHGEQIPVDRTVSISAPLRDGKTNVVLVNQGVVQNVGLHQFLEDRIYADLTVKQRQSLSILYHNPNPKVDDVKSFLNGIDLGGAAGGPITAGGQGKGGTPPPPVISVQDRSRIITAFNTATASFSNSTITPQLQTAWSQFVTGANDPNISFDNLQTLAINFFRISGSFKAHAGIPPTVDEIKAAGLPNVVYPTGTNPSTTGDLYSNAAVRKNLADILVPQLNASGDNNFVYIGVYDPGVSAGYKLGHWLTSNLQAYSQGNRSSEVASVLGKYIPGYPNPDIYRVSDDGHYFIFAIDPVNARNLLAQKNYSSLPASDDTTLTFFEPNLAKIDIRVAENAQQKAESFRAGIEATRQIASAGNAFIYGLGQASHSGIAGSMGGMSPIQFIAYQIDHPDFSDPSALRDAFGSLARNPKAKTNNYVQMVLSNFIAQYGNQPAYQDLVKRAHTIVDRAMGNEEQQNNLYGGIDLEQLMLQTNGSGVRTAFADPRILKILLSAKGLFPQIKSIEPVTVPMVDMLLGFNGANAPANDNDPAAPKDSDTKPTYQNAAFVIEQRKIVSA